ncbi:unnamed protein product [Closterium sp. NIES-65]|nr:unnamed protein product [Closterium sp. NIES-65]
MGYFNSHFSYSLVVLPPSLRVQLMAAVVVTFVSVTGIMTTHSLPNVSHSNHLVRIHSPLNHSLPSSTVHQAFPPAPAAPHLPTPTPHLLFPYSNNTSSSFALLSDPASAHTLLLPINTSLLLPPLLSLSLPALPFVSHHFSSSQADGASALWLSPAARLAACPNAWSGTWSGVLSGVATSARARELLKGLSSLPAMSSTIAALRWLLSLVLSAPRLLFGAAAATTAAVSPGLVRVSEAVSPGLVRVSEAVSPGLVRVSEAVSPGLVRVSEAVSPGLVRVSEAVSPGLVRVSEAVSPGLVRVSEAVLSALLPSALLPFGLLLSPVVLAPCTLCRVILVPIPPTIPQLGLALAYALPIVSLLNGTLTSLADTEKDMVAVERVLEVSEGRGRDLYPRLLLLTRHFPQTSPSPAACALACLHWLISPIPRRLSIPRPPSHSPARHQYLDLQHEPDALGLSPIPGAQGQGGEGAWTGAHAGGEGGAAAGGGEVGGWPREGRVELRRVSMAYRVGLPLVLSDVSFVIPGGSQVGIAGRTGAGKSSLLAALFRLRPLTLASATTATTSSSTSSSSRASGIFIDGVNTAHVSLSCLRTALAIIPQTPLIFHAPIRDNLDPEGRHADVALWDAVRKCHLDAAVGRLGGLDAMVGGSAGGLSLGERQLLCLARVMLRKSKVLCLDECTANIDAATSALMHATIAREFHGVTTITIAHRVSSLLSLRRVLIFESGALVRKHSAILTMLCLSSFKCCSCCGVD